MGAAASGRLVDGWMVVVAVVMVSHLLFAAKELELDERDDREDDEEQHGIRGLVCVLAASQAALPDEVSDRLRLGVRAAVGPIVFLAVWQGVAYSVLIYLAGLQTVDTQVYDRSRGTRSCMRSCR